MKYNRVILRNVLGQISAQKALIILGARRVGKTVLLQDIVQFMDKPPLLLNGEDPAVHDFFERAGVPQLRQMTGNYEVVMVDEAQKIPNIGRIFKLIIDEIPGISIIATGSSAFDLQNEFGEPLTGRKLTFALHPLSQQEFSDTENILETEQKLEDRLLFGSYPEVWQYPDGESRIRYLRELTSDYLYKDILVLDKIRNSEKLQKILRLIAFQVGKEVSNDELSRQAGLSRNTVDKYLDLLSKVFVIFKVQGFSRNLRKEVTKNFRWYFYDNGILNTLRSNFSPLTLRQDIGSLWENYIISERVKYLSNNNRFVNFYFWRTYDQQEIDWVEEENGIISGYEMKWNAQKVKPPAAWKKGYPEAEFSLIHKNNYLAWITDQRWTK